MNTHSEIFAVTADTFNGGVISFSSTRNFDEAKADFQKLISDPNVKSAKIIETRYFFGSGERKNFVRRTHNKR